MSFEKKYTEQSSSPPASPPPPFDNNEYNNYSNNNYTNNKIVNEENASNNKSRFNVEGTRGAIKNGYNKKRKCCCCYIPVCLCWCCGIFCCIFLSIIISLAIVAAVNVSACNALNGKIDTVPVNTFTYDPSVFTTFKVDSRKNLITLRSAITITQSNTTTATNATVNVRIASTKPEDASLNTAQESSDTYVLSIIRSAIDDHMGWTTYLSVPGRCVISRVEVILPQVLTKATAVETDNYDIVVAGHPVPYTTEFRTSTFNGDIFIQDLSAKVIKLRNGNGDINAINLNASSATFESTNGDITVNKLVDLESSLSVSTTNGDINMGVNIKAAQQPTISATSSNGDVTFNFGSTFSGTYSLTTSNGDVKKSDGTSNRAGKFGTGTSNLNVETTNGDINIIF